MEVADDPAKKMQDIAKQVGDVKSPGEAPDTSEKKRKIGRMIISDDRNRSKRKNRRRGWDQTPEVWDQSSPMNPNFPQPYGNMDGPYGNMDGPYSNMDGPYRNMDGPSYGNMVGPYGNMDGPYGNIDGLYGNMDQAQQALVQALAGRITAAINSGAHTSGWN